jgi:hypothetical protein
MRRQAVPPVRWCGKLDKVGDAAVSDTSIGVDPGPVTGLCFLDYDRGRLAGRVLLQCDAGSADVVLRELLIARRDVLAGTGRRSGSVEKFVTGASAGSRGKAADVTRQLVMELAEVLQLFGYQVSIRPAADVKPWASNKRLAAAGIAPGERGMHGDMNHAYDAARHALYGAREAGIALDPLRRDAPAPGSADALLSAFRKAGSE